MSFSESDRVNIRKYLGAGSLFLQQFPALDNSMNIVQSIADGGLKPDNSTELLIKSLLVELQTIDTNIDNLQIQMHVVKAGSDDIEIKPLAGKFGLEMLGRRKIATLALALGTRPLRDYYSPMGQFNEYNGEYSF